MYQVVLVDNDPKNLRSFERLIPWNAYGFEVALATTQPEQAYDFILNNQPALLVTEIEMPVLKGTEMLKRLREQGLDTECVIVSGAESFEYAREAMRYEVAEYFVKPMAPGQMSEILDKVRRKVDWKNNMKQVLNANKKAIQHQATVHTQLDQIVGFMSENYGENLKLQDLAARFFYNKNYLCELFKKHLNTTFSEYLTKIRIEHAKRLLLTGEHSIGDIGEKVGYNAYAHFHKSFKKVTGVTPIKFAM
ncbi:MAG: helix-turn-helix domain-containing protein [Defluviitaleaceae bacterium]|nr:helix-turn-helix domain-containing protein [Defluviitaleaceae bacterium]